MSKDINLNNKYRALLTEVLPYELPLMLDNEGFYQNVQDESLKQIFEESFSMINLKWTIPFDYYVRRYSGDKSRKLSLMHPIIQLRWVDFYEKHDYYMLSLCNNSPFSIRHIANRAQCVFKTEETNPEELQECEKRVEILDDEIEKYYRSYFSYKRYDMMYKFFNSGDYLRLEQKYTHLLKMDIASCFYHIYTHTITWAVKGKEQAKELIGKETFENEFDKLMQYSNYNETNGIIVGPEISRIFAEIIFQRIDVNVLNRLKQKYASLKLGRDYEIRRYVDDHYIYANNNEVLNGILEVYKEELQYYKLFINESKLEFIERPFVSNVSDAKYEINTLIAKIKNNWLSKDDNGAYIHIVKNEMKAFTSVVNGFRSLTHKYNQKYGTLNRYFLSLLISQIGDELKCKHCLNASLGLLLMYSEISFYVFSLDMSASASIKMCRILEYIHRWAKKCTDKTILSEVESRIFREIKRCLDIYETKRKDSETNLEVLNLLLCLSRLMNTPIPRPQIVKFFNIVEDCDENFRNLNYFQICTLLYIMDKDVNFDNLRAKLVSEISRRVTENNALLHADNAMLFFDAIVCPYISKTDKKNILVKLFGYREQTACKKLKIYDKTKRWFFNWNKSYGLSELISKKEYHSPYE